MILLEPHVDTGEMTSRVGGLYDKLYLTAAGNAVTEDNCTAHSVQLLSQ